MVFGLYVMCIVLMLNQMFALFFLGGVSEIRSDVKLIEILCLMLRAASYGKNQT